ncbi:hypothetical protein BBR01nite_62140 [Brevibacillus brevis]|nr:hypothetical protein BBR01nite_62140 [Brevibacillus brevis]
MNMGWISQAQRKKPLLKKLLVYYGYPISINGAWNVDTAVSIYKDYDLIVFGEYQNPAHGAYADTLNIIAKLKQAKPGVEIFGYISIGLAPAAADNFTIEEIKERVMQWKTMGSTGIFLDTFGYDYYVTRERQNEVVQFCHSQGFNVFVNSYKPDYVFKKENMYLDWIDFNGNPKNIEPVVGPQDYYMIENAFYVYSSSQQTMRGSSRSRLLENMECFTVKRDEYGGLTYFEKFRTQFIALDEIIDRDQEYFNTGYIGSVVLGYHGYGASIRSWGASISDYHHYPLPDIPYDAGDRLGTPTASRNTPSSSSNTKYENTLGNIKLTLVWDPDPTDDKNLSKGTRHVLINGNLVGYSKGSTDRRPKIAHVGFMYFDTTLGKPVWWNGTGWVDSTNTTV